MGAKRGYEPLAAAAMLAVNRQLRVAQRVPEAASPRVTAS